MSLGSQQGTADLPEVVTTPASPACPGATAAGGVADRFERVMGSKFVALFASALFDEMMYPAVSASLVDTARIKDDPFARASRTAASDQLAFLADPADRQAEMQRLIELHRDVKGVGPDGERYSGLNPEAWNWNLVSIFFMHRGVFESITGERLDAAGNQAVWDRYRELCRGLQMPGKARQLPETYDDLCAYYDRIATHKLRHTAALDIVIAATRRPQRPSHTPAVTDPLWRLFGPAGGHLVMVLGFGIMHEKVRAILPLPWTRRHEREFALYTRVLQSAYRWLPSRLTETPLARNRREYRRLVSGHQAAGLTSFVPGATQTCGR